MLKTYTRHALSAAFYDPPEGEFKALVEDIKEHGLVEPIVTIGETEILDGWTRYLGCQEAGVEPRFARFEDIANGESPMGFAMSRNFFRKHLTLTQRACIAVDMHEGRWLRGGPQTSVSRNQHKNKSDEAPRVSVKDVAKIARVSPTTVNLVKTIKQKAPEVFAKLKSGELPGVQTVYRADPELRTYKRQSSLNPSPSLIASRALTPMLAGVRDLADNLKLKPAEFAKQWAIWEPGAADKAKRLKAMKAAHQWLDEVIAAIEQA